MVLSAVDAKLRLEMGAERMLANILEPLKDSYSRYFSNVAAKDVQGILEAALDLYFEQRGA